MLLLTEVPIETKWRPTHSYRDTPRGHNQEVSCSWIPFTNIIGCRKRAKPERESESRISQEINEDGNKLPGQLELDHSLWDHIQHAMISIKPLVSTRQQLQELAK